MLAIELFMLIILFNTNTLKMKPLFTNVTLNIDNIYLYILSIGIYRLLTHAKLLQCVNAFKLLFLKIPFQSTKINSGFYFIKILVFTTAQNLALRDYGLG